jgi:solute carrier family 25 phosphate transporter 23/24/25/41
MQRQQSDPSNALVHIPGSNFKDTPVYWKLGVAAIAGTSAGLVMYPNDTVRRILQMQGLEGGTPRYRSAPHCYAAVLREEGLLRFYRGMTPYLVRMVPNAALQFLAYETLKEFFGLS